MARVDDEDKVSSPAAAQVDSERREELQQARQAPDIVATELSPLQQPIEPDRLAEAEDARQDASSDPQVEMIVSDSSQPRSGRTRSRALLSNSGLGLTLAPLGRQRRQRTLSPCPRKVSAFNPRLRHPSLQRRRCPAVYVIIMPVLAVVLLSVSLYVAMSYGWLSLVWTNLKLSTAFLYTQPWPSYIVGLLRAASIPVFIAVYYLFVFYLNRDVPEARTFVPMLLSGRTTKAGDSHFGFSLLLACVTCFILWLMPDTVLSHATRIYDRI